LRVNRNRFFVAVGIAALLVIGSFSYFSRPTRPEPSYRGKSLTKWLKQLDNGEAFGISSGSIARRSPRQVEAAAAIRAMHAEALPLLMQDIHASPSQNSFSQTVGRRIDSFTMSFARLRFGFSDVTEEDRVRWRAAQGLAVLGMLASPAIPELKRLLFTNYFHSSIKEAAYALATMGPEGVAILTNSMQPGTEWSTMCAIWALGQHPEAGAQAIPFLIEATSSPSEGIACGAIQALGLLVPDDDRVRSALTNAFASPRTTVRDDAARALAKLGQRSRVEPSSH
jgi:hypothetical protein